MPTKLQTTRHGFNMAKLIIGTYDKKSKSKQKGISMKKALIVGLNRYPGHELHWCDNDAMAISTPIESNGDGSPNFEVIQIIDTCTKGQLLEAIKGQPSHP